MAPRAVALAMATLGVLVSRAALACPSCATRDGGGYTLALLLGGMMLTPYLVATVVLRVFRKVEAERVREETNAQGDYKNEPQRSV